MTRLIAIGDAHLQHGHRRNADRLAALDRIIAEGSAVTDLGAWLWPGDIFHQRSLPEDRNDVAPRIQAMADRAPVVLCYGNHDAPGDLHILGRLRGRFQILVIDRPQVVRVTLATGETAAIFGFPYPHKSGLVAVGTEVQQVGETAAALLDAIFLKAAVDLAEAQERGALTLMIGHATIVGSISSVGQPMGLERDIAVDANLLARLGDIPKIFNHIHKPQQIYGAHYVGSIGRNDWGEVEDKRYLEIAFYDEDTAIVSHPLQSTPLWHVDGDLTRDGFAWRVRRGPDGEELAAPTSWAGAEVRVRYRFAAEEQAALDLTAVTAPFAGAARVETDPIAIRSRAVRAEAVTKAATLPEKLAAYVAHAGATWTPGLDAKLALLQSVDGTAFLDAVVARSTTPPLREVA